MKRQPGENAEILGAARGFWAARAAEYVPPPPRDPHDHGERNMRDLHHLCLRCFNRKMAWMVNSPDPHISRSAARLANDYQMTEYRDFVKREGITWKWDDQPVDAGLSGEENKGNV